MNVKRQATTTITASFTPTVRTTATTTTNPQRQTVNKTTNRVFSKTLSGKTNIDKKEGEGNSQPNSTENIKGIENKEKEVRNT